MRIPGQWFGPRLKGGDRLGVVRECLDLSSGQSGAMHGEQGAA